MNQPITSKPSSNSLQDSQSDSNGKQKLPDLGSLYFSAKGGDAIRVMGEKFAANAVTGTGSMTVPIATSPGRSGFGTQLSLSYDAGAGGPFGFGLSLSLPSIMEIAGFRDIRTRMTSTSSSHFGAEILVPV